MANPLTSKGIIAMQSDSEARLKSDARFQVRPGQGFMALSLVLVATMMPVFVQAVAERGLARPRSSWSR